MLLLKNLKRLLLSLLFRAGIFCFIFFWAGVGEEVLAQPVPVQIIEQAPGQWQLLRGGKPYYVKGAGCYDPALFASVRQYGGNSVRTWGSDNDKYTQQVLDEAQKNDLTVMMRIWFPLGREFNYSDAVAVEKMIAETRRMVRKFKMAPALLGWGVGNEIVTRSSSEEMYRAMNSISQMIHAEDPLHPTGIMTDGISRERATLIAKNIPDIDFLGVNFYAGLPVTYQELTSSKFTKPYFITEYGANGSWEVPETGWCDSVEASSSEKALQFREHYQNDIVAHKELCLGSYVFLWGTKEEGSPVWFSLLYKGALLEPIDEISYGWKGYYPANRAPAITRFTLNGKSNYQDATVYKLKKNYVLLNASDPEKKAYTVEYRLQPGRSLNGTVETPDASVPYLPGIIQKEGPGGCTLHFKRKHRGWSFKLFVFVRDDQNRLSTSVLPIWVEK